MGLLLHSPLLLICIGIKVASWEHENYGGNVKCLLLDLMKTRASPMLLTQHKISGEVQTPETLPGGTVLECYSS